ncbi:hypothetical protein [Nostoc sp. NMS4]|uniref:hypothetical protein n=1 Tax=Nostoc sp. NMS4 TaxID=2815390 RepID=UPI0025E3AC0F|nr:hypothetical protein [Nostoc sp. NMS4]
MLKPQLSKIPKSTRYQNAAIDYYMGLTNSDYLRLYEVRYPTLGGAVKSMLPVISTYPKKNFSR